MSICLSSSIGILHCVLFYVAGEWNRGSPEFMQKMTDNDIDVTQLPSNVDKRAEIVKTLCHKSGISKNQRAGLYLSNTQP